MRRARRMFTCAAVDLDMSAQLWAVSPQARAPSMLVPGARLLETHDIILFNKVDDIVWCEQSSGVQAGLPESAPALSAQARTLGMLVDTSEGPVPRTTRHPRAAAWRASLSSLRPHGRGRLLSGALPSDTTRSVGAQRMN